VTEPNAPLPIVDDGLGNSSYLVDLGDGRALAVDPSRDPSPYLAAAERAGLQIAFAAETHLHADFVSGAAELAAFGAHVLAPAAGGLELPHKGLGDGDEIDLGGLRLRALATPGHTPEHVSYLLLDGDRPVALFSGGSLLVGAVARTDLIAPDRTEELARALDCGAAIVGVNSRDLETLEIDERVPERLMPLIPSSVVGVWESGVHDVESVRRAAECGADAVLVGSALSRAGDPEALVRALSRVPREGRRG